VWRRRKAEETLIASLSEKEALLKEIHHRVKNNVQIISSMLNLQVGEIRDELSRKLFEESQSRIRSMALIHEMLYQSEDLATVDFRDYIQSLLSSIFRSYSASASRVLLKTEIEQLSLPLDLAIPCGLILNELVCNALKYAFGDSSGTIGVSLARTPSSYDLTVSVFVWSEPLLNRSADNWKSADPTEPPSTSHPPHSKPSPTHTHCIRYIFQYRNAGCSCPTGAQIRLGWLLLATDGKWPRLLSNSHVAYPFRFIPVASDTSKNSS
jgi:two-component sensor histidine kinase